MSRRSTSHSSGLRSSHRTPSHPTRSRWAILPLALGMALLAQRSQAVSLSDGTFAPASWSMVVVSQSGSAQAPLAAQEPAGGDPGSYRRMEHTFAAGAGLLEVFHVYQGGDFDPASLGPGEVLVVDYSEDRLHLTPPFGGSVVGGHPALLQDGTVYIGPNIDFTDTTWTTISLPGLSAAAFTEIGGGAHPDFSAGGSPIAFGYVRRNSTNAGGFTKEHGIDDWSVTTSVAPAGTVLSETKISQTSGGFGGALSNFDRFGDCAAYLGDVDGDAVGDVAVAAGRDDDGASDTGAVWILFLNADGSVKGEQKISATQGGFEGALSGSAEWGECLAEVGDLNYDGVPDLAVGDWKRTSANVASTGAVWILFLNANGTVKSEHLIDRSGIPGLSAGARFGRGIGSAGDVDGDGVMDLAVGTSGVDVGGNNRGGLFVVFLAPDGWVKGAQQIADGVGGLPANTLSDGDFFGNGKIARLGDVDGNGVPDLAVGAEGDDTGGTDRGAVYILFLNADGTVASHQKVASGTGGFTGTLDDGDQFGDSAAALGDLDGDGVVDLAVGASKDDDGSVDRGAVWVLFLNADGTVGEHQKISATTGGFGGSLDSSDRFGFSLAALPDLDGAGTPRLAATAMADDDGGSSRGAVWILELAGRSQPAVCGDFLREAAEACDDGNVESADGCSAGCEQEQVFFLSGTASGGGSVSATIAGFSPSVATSAGQSAEAVLAALATAIDSDPGLQALPDPPSAAARQQALYLTATPSPANTDAGLELGVREDLVIEGSTWASDLVFSRDGLGPLHRDRLDAAQPALSPASGFRVFDDGRLEDVTVPLSGSIAGATPYGANFSAYVESLRLSSCAPGAGVGAVSATDASVLWLQGTGCTGPPAGVQDVIANPHWIARGQSYQIITPTGLFGQRSGVVAGPWRAGRAYAAIQGSTSPTWTVLALDGAGLSARTPGGRGILNLVAPTAIVSGFFQEQLTPDRAVMTQVRLRFVPEPGVLVGSTAGVLGLVVLLRRRGR